MNANQSESIRPHIQIDRDWVMNSKASYVQELLKGYGMVAAKPGKCQDRYQESVLLTPDETVSRACDLAEAFFKEVELRGWLMPVPLYDEIVDQLQDGAPGPAGFIPKAVANR